ncbi:hypothetical protein DPMN_134492 [Dreissena polymorpha]|uniref:Uncharacterized protein n=1 Tax=Dreissena polymorpha TaxID=45954 RepID=A0A9D4FXF8_DREPO|nr:hypothetical protein DPMN_134492 [Dreissena polymorpha]
MPKTKNKKRKERNSSDNNDDPNAVKVRKQRGPSSDIDIDNLSVSELLNKANSVLYGVEALENSVFVSPSCSGSTSTDPIGVTGSGVHQNMADKGAEPTIRDVMVLLTAVSSRLQCLETNMSVMDSIEKRMENFENDMKRLWVVHEDRAKKVEERVLRLEDKVDGVDIHAAELVERVQVLVKERDTLREDVSYLQSQSMRSNLIFTPVPEAAGSDIETPEVTEAKLRQHLVSAFKLTQEVATSLRFERVHRSPGSPTPGKIRNIIAKFSFFKDR